MNLVELTLMLYTNIQSKTFLVLEMILSVFHPLMGMVAILVNSALPFELINSRLHMEFGEKNGQLVLELLTISQKYMAQW